MLAANPFDLAFLDVDMPGMTGFELCSKLRALPMHKKTPVVFVTNLSDFNSRTSSMMAGGNDFIAKPFLFIELTVKALIHVLRGKLQPVK
jgi:DNA-binding response OmpR family regulator